MNSRKEERTGNYGRLTAMALDPIEKKPLAMFYPGSYILSIGSYGCNLRCPWCQNASISMAHGDEVRSVYVSPEAMARKAEECKEHGNIGVAFTYNEPLVSFDYVRDTAKLVQERGMKNVLVTNGCFDLWILEEVLPYIDAMNVDLKAFDAEFYEKIGGSLEKVKAFIKASVNKCHVELTTLIIPEMNDGLEDMEREAKWISSLDERIPLHISRFFPQYKMEDRSATDPSIIYELKSIAENYLKNVFTGNL